jgi:hypothetical protein
VILLNPRVVHQVILYPVIKQVKLNKDANRAESALSPTVNKEGLTQHISPLSLCEDKLEASDNEENKVYSNVAMGDCVEENIIDENAEQYDEEDTIDKRKEQLRKLFKQEVTPGMSIAQTLKVLNRIAPTSEDYLEGALVSRVQSNEQIFKEKGSKANYYYQH